MNRIIGWEDEFRITDGDRVLSLADLLPGSQRMFFDQAKHMTVGERKQPLISENSALDDYDTSRTDCVWTWYGGKLYDEQDALVEASAPPVPLNHNAMKNLADMVSMGRAQIGELVGELPAQGVSSQLNFMLDSDLDGEDLCDESKYVDRNVPSQGMTMAKAHKLGCDISRVLVRTMGPAIAYLNLNSLQQKGAIYRPRGRKRLELALPYVPRQDQMIAGALFWFAAVEYVTRLIKDDLRGLGAGFVKVFQGPDYYQRILEHFPLQVEDLRLKQSVSFRLGFEVAGGYETAIQEHGSQALVKTTQGEMPVTELLQHYLDKLQGDVSRWGGLQHRAMLEEFASGLRIPSVDVKDLQNHFQLSHYLKSSVKNGATAFLNSTHIDTREYPIASLVREPNRSFSNGSDRLIRRSLRDDQDWHRASLEIVVEDFDEEQLKIIDIEVPREELPAYLILERRSRSGRELLESIQKYKIGERTFKYPNIIFGYGTFLSDEVVEGVSGYKPLSRRNAETVGTLYHLEHPTRDFPALIESYYDDTPVFGQLIEVADFKRFILASDRYEGTNQQPPLFIRALREVIVESGEKVLCWMYLGNPNHPFVRSQLRKENEVPDGRWEKFLRKSN